MKKNRADHVKCKTKIKINKTKQINKTSRNLVIKPLSENVILGGNKK